MNPLSPKSSHTVGSSHAARSSYALSALLALLGAFCLSMMNAAVKWLALAGYPTMQIVAFNCSIAALLLLGFLVARGQLRDLKVKNPLVMGYVLSAMGACLTLFYAFGTGRIAEVTGVILLTPLVIAALAHFILHERLSRYQLGIVLIGLIGVMLVLKPRPHLADAWPLMVALLGTFFLAMSHVLVRKLSATISTISLPFFFYICTIPVAIFLGAYLPIQAEHVPVFLASGLFDVAGLALLYLAYKRAPAPQMAPFQYSQLLFGGTAGYVLWQEMPDFWSFAGAGIIVAAGIVYTRTILDKRV